MTDAVCAFVTAVASVSVTVAPLIATLVTLSATVVPFAVTETAKALVAGISLGTSSLSKWMFIDVPLTSVVVGCGGVASTVIDCVAIAPT